MIIEAQIQGLIRALTDAVNYIDHAESYRGCMNAEEVAVAVQRFQRRVSEIEIARSGPALASFNIAGARALLQTIKKQEGQ